MKVLSHLKQQLQKNNEGASLVNVLILISIAVILTSAVLIAVLYNFYMKQQDTEAQQNLYDAEAAMEEIRMGLISEVSEAAAFAYGETLSHYSDATQVQKTENFQKAYRDELKKRLLAKSGELWYNRDVLYGYLKHTKWNGNYGAVITTKDGQNALNVEKKGLVLKNVSVSYTDKRDNQTQITTDIVLNYPAIDFEKSDAKENILCYGLIAGDGYEQTESGETVITGNAYLGKQAKVENGSLILCGANGNLGRTVIEDDLLGDNTVSLSAENMELWTKNVVLDNSSSFVSNHTLYVANDITLNKNAQAVLSGNLYAYGNPDAAEQTKSLSDKKDDIKEEAANYSSSVILNGKIAKLDMSGLGKMMISGVSYINGMDDSDAGHIKKVPVASGQSVMTKGDQRAYLIPGELIGAGYEEGGSNPMTAEQWKALRERICMNKGYASEDEIRAEDIVDFQKGVPGIGVSLASLGAGNGYDKAAMTVTGGFGTMYFLFMKFDTQEDRNSFVRKYYQRAINYNMLKDNISYYAGGGVMMPSEAGTSYNMYLQGNALTSEGANLVVADTLTSAANTPEEAENRLQQEIACYDSFFTITKTLSSNYEELTAEEKQRNIFQNLVAAEEIKSEKTFVDEEGNKAVVTNGNYAIKNTNAGVNLVIAKGDVSVHRDFEGLILCAGKVTVKSGCNITADAKKVASILQSEYEDGKTPAVYIRNLSSYLIGGVGDTEEQEGSISLSETVNYNNWKKN